MDPKKQPNREDEKKEKKDVPAKEPKKGTEKTDRGSKGCGCG
jgi:hypothetical protein